MVDALGYRLKFGVLAPSTNTVVEPEYARLQPHGVTNHMSRMWIPDDPVNDDDDFVKMVENIRAATMSALDCVMTCHPDFVILGVSVETFWDGAERAARLEAELNERAGVPVTMGSRACEAALAAHGRDKPIRRIAVLTPYTPVGDKHVVKFFADLDIEVTRLIGLKCKSPVLIAHETPSRLAAALRDLDGPDVDAIVQVGTNLACLDVAAEAERWLKKPVIAINAATYWHALRRAGIDDKLHGFGRLLEDW